MKSDHAHPTLKNMFTYSVEEKKLSKYLALQVENIHWFLTFALVVEYDPLCMT
jgi:hypothetical protein